VGVDGMMPRAQSWSNAQSYHFTYRIVNRRMPPLPHTFFNAAVKPKRCKYSSENAPFLVSTFSDISTV
jgi:hypothetical protein